jgi:hypothetical protein
MAQTLSHTFTFQTNNTSNKNDVLENIMSITEEDEKKHYVQYMQYWVANENGKQLIYKRQTNIKLDRYYYLEIANISIDDNTRRGYFFSILGKRTFGSSNKRIDYYLFTKDLNTETLRELYKEKYESTDAEPCHTERNEYSTNNYKYFPLDMGSSYVVFLDQTNVKKRKKLLKSFVIELNKDDFEYFNSIDIERKKIDYLFNKIGKSHFKSLPVEKVKLTSEYKDIKSLANSQLNRGSFEMEKSSRINNNSVFRALKENPSKMEKINLELYSKAYDLLNNPDSENAIRLFSIAIIKFGTYVKGIKQLEEITSYFTTIHMLAEYGTISYLLNKHDPDFRDIFLYMLESFTHWNSYLTNTDENVRMFNIATVDLEDALRYLVDRCFRFKHEYQCVDIKEDNFQEVKTGAITNKENKDYTITSAQEYFSEIEVDHEAYEELNELEYEILELAYASNYDAVLNMTLARFFEGYTHVLNPLFEFRDLSYSLMLLSQKLLGYEIGENSKLLLDVVKAFVSDLLEWKKVVLVEKTASDIHYMNKSFYSNILQIEILLESRNEVFNDNIEFF